MKYTEIRELSNEQLLAKISEESQSLIKVKFAHAVSSVENPMKIRLTRKNIARLSTELSKRRIVEATVEAQGEAGASHSLKASASLDKSTK